MSAACLPRAKPSTKTVSPLGRNPIPPAVPSRCGWRFCFRSKPKMKTEIEIPISELKSVLPGLGKVTSRSSSLPILGCIQVNLDQDRQFISLQANDLDQIATVRLENKGHGLPGAILVSLDTLSKIVK